MARKNKSPISLKDVISEIFGSGVVPFDPDDTRIWKIWEEVVGSTIASHAQPLRIRNKLLRVGVSDPIWFQELSYMAEDIKERLNLTLGRKAVDRIEFSVGLQKAD